MTIAPLRHASRGLVARLLDAPDLATGLRALPPPSFGALVRKVGVEDAGELLALATTEQIVAAFDEDLFANAAPGEREAFDPGRFAVWLEVLLEAGDEALAGRFVELSEDFAVHALSSLVWVFDDDALRARMREGGDDADAADKALESALSEEIDGYLLVAREPAGWDAVLSLVLALDRDHRDFLVRILDRCVDVASPLLDDLDELATRLTEAESLAEDVEAEREARRSALGYVDPRAAKSFLALARQPTGERAASAERDPITRAYFRELERRPAPLPGARTAAAAAPRLLEAGDDGAGVAIGAPNASREESVTPIVAALRRLEAIDARLFAERLEEISYLANVLAAAAGTAAARLGAAEAIEAAMATVAFGAQLESGASGVTPEALAETLRACSADLLFRRASATLGGEGFLRSQARGEIGVHVPNEDSSRPEGRDRGRPARRGGRARGGRAR